MDKLKIKVPQKKIAEFCRKHHIKKLAFYGSVLRGDFRPDSYIDILLEFAPGHTPGFGFVTIQDELQELFGRRVDLHTFRAAEGSRNIFCGTPF